MSKFLKAKKRVFGRLGLAKKMKTKSAAKKRFKVKSSGIVKFAHANRRHNTGLKRRKHKNRLRLIAHFGPVTEAMVKKSMPYS
jgi:large subunit ribosomal protein L35